MLQLVKNIEKQRCFSRSSNLGCFMIDLKNLNFMNSLELFVTSPLMFIEGYF